MNNAAEFDSDKLTDFIKFSSAMVETATTQLGGIDPHKVGTLTTRNGTRKRVVVTAPGHLVVRAVPFVR
jgi:hypothetical protein